MGQLSCPVYLFHITLSFCNIEPWKNKHFLILHSSLVRYSWENKLKMIFEILWVLFEKISVFYSNWPKSWIWQDPGTSKCHLHNDSKEVFWPKDFLNFMHGFKSTILPELKNCQNGTFEPMHEIQKFFWPNDFFWSIMKMSFTENISNISQDPGFRSVRAENWVFLKKDSQGFKKYFQFAFLWIPSKTEQKN